MNGWRRVQVWFQHPQFANRGIKVKAIRWKE